MIIIGSRMHAVTFGMWIILRVAKTTDAHSGYGFNWSPVSLIPFGNPLDFHNYHHLFFKGNYGSFLNIWDYLCGTIDPGYHKFSQPNSKSE
jgi:sterol desaturase/sphingolipid hydroxylase (fatty acid hydroxylase superfamily)